MRTEEAKQSKYKKVIITLIIIAVIAGGIIYVSTKASEFKPPSHSDFQRQHGN